MSVECQCGRKTDLFLCNACGDDLAEILTGLAVGTATNLETGYTREMPGWISFLEDAAHGGTRLGESARRSNEKTAPMLAHLGPKASTCQKGDDFKGAPSEILADLHGLLSHWVNVVNTGTETLAIEDA